MDINGKMAITSARYVQDLDGNNEIVEIVSEGITMCVPLDDNNTDYKCVLEWVADGNTITPA